MNAETIITSVIPTGDDKRAGRGASLRLNGVRKVYGQNVVNDDISIDIQPGQFVTLLGA
ncbi:MAG: polyamine ABC transporter ATP-binding protein, partial [Microbacterium sp.]